MTTCLRCCYHLIDYLVANGGYALARDASEHVNRIIPMKWPQLREAKIMMLQKGWISNEISNREFQITDAGRAWHLSNKEHEGSHPDSKFSASRPIVSEVISVGRDAEITAERAGLAADDQAEGEAETVRCHTKESENNRNKQPQFPSPAAYESSLLRSQRINRGRP